MGTDFSSEQSSKRRGFSLVESAIVLAVVGLVLGGIWVAAASIVKTNRINDTAAAILSIARGASALFPTSNYPTTRNIGGSTDGFEGNVTNVLKQAGILPASFAISDSGLSAMSPMGVIIQTQLGYDDAIGGATFYISFWNEYSQNKIKSEDCNRLVRLVTASDKKGELLKRVTIANQSPPNEHYIVLYPPFNTVDLSCPSSLRAIHFYFDP